MVAKIGPAGRGGQIMGSDLATPISPEHLSLKIQYVEFDINVPLRQQYIKNLMSKIYDIELLIYTPHQH